MKNVYLLLLLGIITLINPVSADVNYYYANISISDNPGITDYQTHTNIDYRSGMSSDFANIRLYDAAGNEIPYWIESYTASTSADVWYQIDSWTTLVQVRWGITGETTNESNIKAVMVFGDDFAEGSLNSTLWTNTATNGTREFGNGVMRDTITGTGDLKNVITAKTDTNDASVITCAKTRTTTSTGNDCGARVGIKSSSTDVGAKLSLHATASPAAKTIQPLHEMVSWGTSIGTYTENTWYTLELRHDYSSKFYYRNGQSGAWSSWTINPSGTHLCLHSYTTSNTVVVEYDHIYQRKYAATEPTSAMGSTFTNSSDPATITYTGSDNIVIPANTPYSFNFTTDKILDNVTWYVNGVPMNTTGQELIETFNKGNEFYNISVIGISGNDTSNMLTWIVHTKREMATVADSIPTYDDANYNTFLDNFTDFNSTNMATSAVTPFTDLMGRSFYLIMFVMPFVLLWQKQGKLTIPATLALITGCLFIGFVPDQYRSFITYAVILSFAANLFFMGRERM